MAGQPKLVMLKAQAQTIIIALNQIKMKTNKMSLAYIQGKLSRAEMKKIMAGSTAFCGTGGDMCGEVNGTTYTCCQTDRHRVCNPNTGVCDEP